MGSCGCGEIGSTGPVYQVPGPGDTIYIIEICRPCNYCQTPFGVSVHQHGPAAIGAYGGCEDLFDGDQVETWGEDMTHVASLPIFDPWKLRRHVAREAKRAAEEEALDGFNAEFVVEDIFDEWLRCPGEIDRGSIP